mgnify:CR=1 FL=1
MAKPATRQKGLDQPAIVQLIIGMQADKASGIGYEYFFLDCTLHAIMGLCINQTVLFYTAISPKHNREDQFQVYFEAQ